MVLGLNTGITSSPSITASLLHSVIYLLYNSKQISVLHIGYRVHKCTNNWYRLEKNQYRSITGYITPLQLVQNTVARLIYNVLKRMLVTPVYQFALATNSCSLKLQGISVCLQNHHWLCTPLPKFITSDLCASRSLHSARELCIIVPTQRGTKSLSLTFSLTVPSWWNDLPNSIRASSVN